VDTMHPLLWIRVAVHGELCGQKRFSFKPPLVAPPITQLRRVMSLGHIEDGVLIFCYGRMVELGSLLL
jgi:hypothetical protein